MRKTVYHNKHYVFKKLLENKEFLKDVQWLKNNFKHFNIGIPENGFDSYKKYLKWNKKFWDKVSKCQKSLKFKKAMDKIKDVDGMIHGHENIQKMHEIQDKYIPVIYGEYIDHILQKYNLNTKDKKNKEFMILYIFLGRTDFQEDPFRVIHIRNEKTERMELFVKIEPWTTNKDILNNWKLIEKQQKRYSEYIARNKEWKEFKRDMEIYDLYEHFLKKKKDTTLKAADMAVYAELHGKYPDINIESIRKIYTRAKQRLGEKTSNTNS